MSAEVTDAGFAGHPRRWLILDFGLVGQFVMAAATGTVNVALPSIRADLHASAAQIQWVVVLYQLSYALMLINGGRLGDMFGRRRLFLLGCLGFVLSSTIAGLAPNVTVLVAARLVQGIAGGLASPQVLALVQVIFPMTERPRAIARFAMTSAASFTVGQLVTGALLSLDVFGLGWRAAFLMNVPLGLVAFTGAFILFPAPAVHRDQRIDSRGITLASLAMVLLLFPLIEGRSAHWPPVFFVVMAASVPVGLLFIRHERRLSEHGGQPLVDVDLFAARSFRLGLVLAAITQLSFFPAFFFMTITLQSGFGLSPWKTALTLTPMPVFVLVTAMTTGRLIPLIGSRLFAIAAVLLILGTVGVVMAFDRSLAAPTIAMIPGLVLQGAGQGFTLPTMLHLTLFDVPPHSAGSASGVYQTMQQLTSSIGVAVLGIVFFGTLNGQTGQTAYAQAFSTTMVLVVGLHIALFAVHFVLPRRLERVSIDNVDPPDGPMPVSLQPEG